MSERFDHRSFLSQLTTQPGVYRMYGTADDLLYVGKARNLKKRVSTYFLRASGNPRIESMASQIQRVEVTVTRTEDEALHLERSDERREGKEGVNEWRGRRLAYT